MSELLQLTPDQLAREFSEDSSHIKRDHSQNPVTLESLEQVAEAYFESHPQHAAVTVFEPHPSANPAPTREEVESGLYILNKLSRSH